MQFLNIFLFYLICVYSLTLSRLAVSHPCRAMRGHSGSKAQQSLGFLLASYREILYQPKQNAVSSQNGLILISGLSDFYEDHQPGIGTLK